MTSDEYSSLMKDELEDLAGHRLKAIANVEANKAKIGRWYDKKVKAKAFEQVDFADRNKEFKIRQMVANMGRAIQNKQMCSW